MSLTKSYAQLIQDLKAEIQTSRIKAHLSVNKEMILLYWKIGKKILERQEEEGWGSKVIERLSDDLRKEFPEMKGLSSLNLSRMRMFSSSFSDAEIVSQAVTEIPWGHIQEIVFKVKDQKQRYWYVHKTIENGWSRNVLVHQIKSDAYGRSGSISNNFETSLPKAQSDLASEIFKDPYNLEFLDIQDNVSERALEKTLVENLRNFLIELGSGFAFVGSQYPLSLEDEDYYLDLLFYHLKLRCYVVIELKRGKFKPEYAGKLNFYTNLVDAQLKNKEDQPTIGLILCGDKKGMTVEYALKGIETPLGVSAYDLTSKIPTELKGILPTVEEIRESVSLSEKDSLEVALLQKMQRCGI